ncbi:signal peptide peptidase SppA [Candidatus Sumerlaeota bacterium]|nr:signal peptide peptidase SppA [Candidatus Sumerlaeota bacterium]
MEPSSYPAPVKRKSSSRYLLPIFLVALALFVFFIIIIVLLGALMSSARGRVALLDVQGVIYDARQIIEELHFYEGNPAVRAIVIRIDTPGGSAAASQELFYEIYQIRKKRAKPVIASMGNVAASGGYYIACGAEEIYANPATLTGSIGVIMNFTNWEQLVDKIGIRFETVKSGQFKDIGSPNRPMTDNEKELLQSVIDDVYGQFTDDVYQSRRKGLERAFHALYPEEDDSSTTDGLRQFMAGFTDGRIFSGRQAYEYGFVDHLGNLDDALQRAGRLAGIKGRPRILQKKKPMKFFGLTQSRIDYILRSLSPDYPSLEYRYIPRNSP